MKIKYIDALPLIIIFASPWMHRLAFENLMKALPEMNRDFAHFMVFICMALIALFWPMIRGEFK